MTLKSVSPLTRGAVETVPDLVPTEGQDVFTRDCWLEEITLTNGSGNDRALVTITDRQDTPRLVFEGYMPDMLVFRFEARYCPGGVRWISSAPGVVGYMRARM